MTSFNAATAQLLSMHPVERRARLLAEMDGKKDWRQYEWKAYLQLAAEHWR